MDMRNENVSPPLAKTFAVYQLCFAGVLVLVGCVVIYVSVRGAVESLVTNDLRANLQSHVHSLEIALGNRLEVLHGYAKMPIVTSGVMHPRQNRHRLADFFESLSLIGEETCFRVYDFRSKPILTNSKCSGEYFDSQLTEPLLAGMTNSSIRAVSVAGKSDVGWILAVPIRYNGLPEGVLAAYFTKPLEKLVGAAPGYYINLTLEGETISELGNEGRRELTVTQPLWIPGLHITMGGSRKDFSEMRWALIRNLSLSLLVSSVLLYLLLHPIGRRIIIAPHVQLRRMADKLGEKNLALRREAAERIQVMDLLEYKSIQLEEQERFFRDVIEDQSELICRFSTTGIISFVNKAYCEFVGEDKESLEGAARFMVSLDELSQILGGLTPENSTAEAIFFLKDAKGIERWVQWTLRCLFAEDRTPLVYQTVGRDVTENRKLQLALEQSNRELEEGVANRTKELLRKNSDLAIEISERRAAEEEAKSKERLLNTLLEGLNAAFVVIEHDSDMIVTANRGAEELFRVPMTDLIQQPCSSVLQSLVGNSARVVCGLDDNAPEYSEERVQYRDGSATPVDRFILPVSETHRAVVLLDTSARKELERQLNIAQKMESIGLLASGIAHEINTPIQYIGDSIRFLQDGFFDLQTLLETYEELTERTRKQGLHVELTHKIEDIVEEVDIEFVLEEFPRAFERALDGVDRVARIVLAMKNFSHPGAEEKKAVDLNRALENTITVAKNEWKYYAQMRTELDDDLPLVTCLPGDINQAFLNIIVNAVHAIRDVVADSGKLGEIVVSTRKEGNMAVIRIQDTGSGISAENLNKVFDPFFTTKEVGKGTGQGLAIVHDIVVNKHAGSISVESEPGKGSMFSITLPINPLEGA